MALWHTWHVMPAASKAKNHQPVSTILGSTPSMTAVSSPYLGFFPSLGRGCLIGKGISIYFFQGNLWHCEDIKSFINYTMVLLVEAEKAHQVRHLLDTHMCSNLHVTV